MRGQSCLRPVFECAFCSARNELLRSFADQANYLGACFVVEALSRQNLRDLFAELSIALQRFLNVLPDGDGQSCL